MLTKKTPPKLKSIKVTPDTHRKLCALGRSWKCRTITETVSELLFRRELSAANSQWIK